MAQNIVIPVDFDGRNRRRLERDPVDPAAVTALWELLEEWAENATFVAIRIGDLVDSVLGDDPPPGGREAFRNQCHRLRLSARRLNRDMTQVREQSRRRAA